MNIELSSVICMYELKFEYMYDVIKDKKKKHNVISTSFLLRLIDVC